MPRASKAQMEKNREIIVEAAGRLFRERGFTGTSIGDVMGEAGLTHGGFYKHFASKDELTSVACEDAFLSSARRWRARIADKEAGSTSLASIVESYLSTRSRNSPGSSCPAAGMASDVAREPASAAVRFSFANGVEDLIRILAAHECRGSETLNRLAAMADFSTMVGALVLSRALSSRPAADEILNAAKARILDSSA